MKIYLVGGAVRDELLNYPFKERDWVVVGATADELLSKGYKQVGRDFPVFLHPKTGEEYALARTEKKTGNGYYGFACDTGTEVTLEDDLMRRDLTINAIAKDVEGQIIDPYNGLADLKSKTLRHVSAAFSDDPVRVLRIARFAARYHHLGFKLADSTRQLMAQMVRQGELSFLVAERVWQEWQKSLVEKNPEQFILVLRACNALKIILPELDCLFGVPNKPHHHPEIDSGIHSLLVLQWLSQHYDSAKLRFAALLHDLGKGVTPLAQWPSHPDHEERGIIIIKALCERLRIPQVYRNCAVLASRLHLMIHRLMDIDAEAIVTTLEQADAFRRPEVFLELLIISEADAQGCLREINYHQAPRWKLLLTELSQITAVQLIEQNFQGEAIKIQLHQLRVERTHQLLSEWKKNET